MLTVPDGSAESFTADVEWVGANLEHPVSRWTDVRLRAERLGVRVIPWVRLCRLKEGENFDTIKQRLLLLADTAEAWDEVLILPNYEDEASTYPPWMVADYLDHTLNWRGEAAWSTLGWLQNDLDWTPLAQDPVLLQIFQKDMGWPVDEIAKKQADSVYHAREKGFTYVGVTFQTYAGAQPGWYNLEGTHSVYPGNLIQHGEWDDWFPQ